MGLDPVYSRDRWFVKVLAWLPSMLIRQGFAVYQGIFNAGLLSRFSKIPGFHTQFDIPTGSAGYRTLHNLSDPNQRNVVLTAFADAMSACWILGCAVMLSALVVSNIVALGRTELI